MLVEVNVLYRLGEARSYLPLIRARAPGRPKPAHPVSRCGCTCDSQLRVHQQRRA
jgi:hypothetical protein